jgi:tyrosine aminotransferase
LSKIYCLPGWRLGWVIVYNNHGYLDNVITHLHKLNQISLHPTSIIQYALPRIFKEVKEDHFEGMKSKLRESSNYIYEKMSQIRGLEPVKASAAMYMIVKINL